MAIDPTDDPTKETEKEVTPLDEGDIALLKTYVNISTLSPVWTKASG